MLVINLKTDQVPTHQQLVEELVSINYCRVSMVLEPGDFAVRGAIIDVFPLNETFPIRIECFGDDIERLTSFNVHNQRSISTIEEISIHSFDTDKQKISVSGEIVNDELIASLSEGDYVVHENFGIGCFQGLKRMSAGGISGEYAYIRYQGEDKLFVPLDQMNLLHRYAGSELASKINSLTDGKWKRTRAKVEKATEALAQDIYELYKVRLTQDG
ncbi:MAG: transcription-repair coupling factor (superfamily II helicase), partial [Candidatus Marinamargulisbacteria bacterium]